MSDKDVWERWLGRGQSEVPAGFADDVMAQIGDAAPRPAGRPSVQRSSWLNFGLQAAACAAALLVGLIPFVYGALLARLIVF